MRRYGHGIVASAGWGRRYTRGIPYSPVGTIQDFTSSPMHTKLAELQADIDKRAGRAPTDLYKGPTITTPKGPRPLLSREQRSATPSASSNRLGHGLPHASLSDMMPPQSDSFQQDLRQDPSYADVPDHVTAARQRMLVMQSDSYGESIRGAVPPPPPLADDAPRAYTAPRIPLDDSWWILMLFFAFVLVLMAKYGK